MSNKNKNNNFPIVNNKDRVYFKENASLNIFNVNNLTSENLKTDHSQKTPNSATKYAELLNPSIEMDSKKSYINNKLKLKENFDKFHIHNYINNKYNKNNTLQIVENDKEIKKNFTYKNLDSCIYNDNTSNSNLKIDLYNNQTIDYHKMYNIKKSEDKVFYGLYDPFQPVNPVNEKTHSNSIYLKNEDFIDEMKQQDNFISKLKSFALSLPKDDESYIDIDSNNNDNDINNNDSKNKNLDSNKFKDSQSKKFEFKTKDIASILREEKNDKNYLHLSKHIGGYNASSLPDLQGNKRIYANINSNFFERFNNID